MTRPAETAVARPSLIRRFLALIGVDRAVGMSFLPSLVSKVAGPIQFLVIAAALTDVEQGYFFLFGSILALQVFFELGLGTVVVQVIGHERGLLQMTPEGRLVGDPVAKARLVKVFQQATKWYGIAALLLVLVVFPAGWKFISDSRSNSDVVWVGPWMALVLATGLGLALTPVISSLEGCNLVIEAAQVNLARMLTNFLVMWAVFFLGGKLYSAPIGALAAIAAAVWMISRQKRLMNLLSDIWHGSTDGANFSWKHDIWPFQWRIALSWLSGYFIYQLFVPVLFRYQGPELAGRMGMSLSMLSAVTQFSIAWVNPKVPYCCQLIAQERWAELDRVYRHAAIRSLAVSVIMALAVIVVVIILQATGHRLGDRFLPARDLSLLAIVSVINHAVLLEAIYLRAHKKEPFLAISMLNGLFTGSLTWLLGRHGGATGMILGYLFATLIIGLGAGTAIFIAKRREWHGDNASLQPVPDSIPAE